MRPTVVVYYSRSGKTRMVAERLAEAPDADLEEIRESADRRGMLGFLRGGRDAALNRPADLVSRHTVEGRRTVLLGMPVWAGGPPPAVHAYLASVDLAGKVVCAFCTHNGSGGEKTLDALAESIPGGLAERADFKRPKAGDEDFQAGLAEWIERVRPLAAPGEDASGQ
jgi:flavodoxin